MKYCYLIVGAGFTGAVITREIAEKCNEPVLVIDRRNHVSGNAFDHNDKNGILIHQYGPHIFHTNSLPSVGIFIPVYRVELLRTPGGWASRQGTYTHSV